MRVWLQIKLAWVSELKPVLAIGQKNDDTFSLRCGSNMKSLCMSYLKSNWIHLLRNHTSIKSLEIWQGEMQHGPETLWKRTWFSNIDMKFAIRVIFSLCNIGQTVPIQAWVSSFRMVQPRICQSFLGSALFKSFRCFRWFSWVRFYA